MLEALQAALGFQEAIKDPRRCSWCKRLFKLTENPVRDIDGNVFHTIAEADKYDIEREHKSRYELRYMIEPAKKMVENGVYSNEEVQ